MSQSTCWTGCRDQLFPLPASEDRASHSGQSLLPAFRQLLSQLKIKLPRARLRGRQLRQRGRSEQEDAATWVLWRQERGAYVWETAKSPDGWRAESRWSGKCTGNLTAEACGVRSLQQQSHQPIPTGHVFGVRYCWKHFACTISSNPQQFYFTDEEMETQGC